MRKTAAMKTTNKLFCALALVVFCFSLCNGASQVAQQTPVAQAEEQTSEDVTEQLKKQKEFLKNCILPSTEDTVIKIVATSGGLIIRAIGAIIEAFILEEIARGCLNKKIIQNNTNYRRLCLATLLGIPIATILADSYKSTRFYSKEIGRTVPILGGRTGSFLYSQLHKFFLHDKICLKRTIKAFEKTPEKFPAQAIELLKKVTEQRPLTSFFQSYFDTMTLKEIAEICQKLRAMAK